MKYNKRCLLLFESKLDKNIPEGIPYVKKRVIGDN
jgi:hypothetical protein